LGLILGYASYISTSALINFNLDAKTFILSNPSDHSIPFVISSSGINFWPILTYCVLFSLIAAVLGSFIEIVINKYFPGITKSGKSK
jgi:hypothetical protein